MRCESGKRATSSPRTAMHCRLAVLAAAILLLLAPLSGLALAVPDKKSEVGHTENTATKPAEQRTASKKFKPEQLIVVLPVALFIAYLLFRPKKKVEREPIRRVEVGAKKGEME